MNVTIAEVLEMEPAMRRDPRMTMERATRRNKVEVKRTDEDDPARAAFVDELRAKRVAAMTSWEDVVYVNELDS